MSEIFRSLFLYQENFRNCGLMWASAPTAVNYIQLQTIIFVGTFTPDGPCKINRKRTVEDACPYGEINVYVTDKLQFVGVIVICVVGDDAHIVPLYIHGRMWAFAPTKCQLTPHALRTVL